LHNETNSVSVPRTPVFRTRLALYLCFAAAFLVTEASSLKEFGTSDDPGFTLLANGVWAVLGSIGAASIDGLVLIRGIQCALMLLCAVLFVHPGLPVRISAGALLSLLLLGIHFGLPFTAHRTEALAVLVVAVMLVSAAFSSRSKCDLIVAFGLGVFGGYLQLVRESLSPVLYLPVVAGGITAALLAYWHSRQAPKEPSARHVWTFHLIMLLTFAAGAMLSSNVPRWLFSITQKSELPSHGAGYPLFMGLGFVGNPYNIAWDDDTALAYGELVRGRPFRMVSADQEELVKAAIAIITHDPALLLRNMVAKATYILKFFVLAHDRGVIAGDLLDAEPSLLLSVWVGAAALGALMCVWWFARLWSIPQALLLLEVTALGTSSLAILLLIVPFYMAGLLTFFIAIVCIVVPAFQELNDAPLPSDAERFAVKRTLAVFAGAIVFASVAAAGWVLFRDVMNDREASEIMAAGAWQKGDRLNLEYAYKFNRLPVDDQQRLITRIMNDPPPLSYRPITPPSGPFVPTVVLYRDRVLYIVGRFQRTWRMTLPARVQGPRNSVLIVWPQGPAREPILHYIDRQLMYQKITDANWDDKYHMIALPARFDPTNLAGLGIYNFSGGGHVEGLALQPVAEAVLERIQSPTDQR
jgi:hypothetical protein